jgi:hypothetical protein
MIGEIMNQIVNLDDLAVQINSENDKLRSHVKNSLTSALRLGELLTQAKSLVKHGEWTQWLEGNCTVSDRQARKYIQLYEGRDQLPIENGPEAVLSINSALRLLSEDGIKYDSDFVNTLIEKAQSQMIIEPAKKPAKPATQKAADNLPILVKASRMIAIYCQLKFKKSYDSDEQRLNDIKVLKSIVEMIDRYIQKLDTLKIDLL